MPLREVVEFRGHPMIRATHETTIELTKEAFLSQRGDCILGISASKGLAELAEKTRSAISSDRARIEMTIQVGEESFSFSARGDHRLSLSSKKDLVIRRSGYVCDRTLAVSADAAAIDVPRRIVERLRDPGSGGNLTIEVSLA